MYVTVPYQNIVEGTSIRRNGGGDTRVKEPACLRVNPCYCGGISRISRLFSRVIAPFTAKIPPNNASLPSVNSNKLRKRV